MDRRRLPLWMASGLLAFASPALSADCNDNGIDDAIDLVGPTPIAYWRFEETGTVYADSGPNGLAGFGVNAIASDDVPVDSVPRTGAANAFSCGLGGGGFVTVPDPIGLLSFGGDSFTVEAWVRITQLSDDSGPNQRQFLVQKKLIGAPDAGLDYAVLVQKGGDYQGLLANFGKTEGYSGRELMVLFGTGSGVWAVTSNLSIDTNGWHHVSVAYDSVQGSVRFGLDGIVETIDAPGPGHWSNAGPLVVGAHSNSSGAYNQFLRGVADEVRIFDGAIDAAQLLRSYEMADCNANGVPDGCDVASNGDCDGNGQPDECQLVGNDCDANGIPDQCDPDCDGNGSPDACDIAKGLSFDCQTDGIPDGCQLASAAELSYDSGWARIAWRADEPYMGWLNRFNVVGDADTVVGIEVLWGIMPIGTPVDVYVWTDPNGDGNPSDAQVLWTDTVTVLQTSSLSSIDVPAIDVGDTGSSFFVGFIVPVTTEDFPAALDIEGVPVPDRSWGVGSFSPIDPNNLAADAVEFGTINDLLFGNVWIIRARMQGPGTDCNGNGVPDDCDIAGGSSTDADRNGVPDECEDCNANGLLDGFEIAAGTSSDCNGDGIPDSCQLTANDCNQDGIPDDCQLATGDCNGNGILDACDIASGYDTDVNANGVPDECEDCNGNGVVDSFDIAQLVSADCNDDGIPDECQFGDPASTLRYAHDDGVQEANLHFVGAVLEFAWMNRFVVQPGGEWITAVEVVWGDTYPDLPAQVVLWSDPDGDGNPLDAQVVITVATRSMKIDFPQDNLNVVPIPPTYIGEAGTSFFVGVHFDDIYGSGKPVALDLDPPHSGAGWVAYALTGTLNIYDLTQNWLLQWPHHDLLVRAIGSDGQLEEDCNVNQELDVCDIALGASGDANGNGVPDECETIGDLNGDGQVDATDLALLLGGWGSDGTGDLDGDGVVGAPDLALLLGAWTG